MRDWPAAAASIAVIVGVAALVLGVTHHRGAERNHAAAAVGTVITLDPGIGDLTFEVAAPPQLATGNYLSASQALAKFQASDQYFHPPADATYTFGYYTAKIDGNSYRFENSAAWGISYHLCAPLRNPFANSSNTRIPCTRWVFLDARTGMLMEGAWAP